MPDFNIQNALVSKIETLKGHETSVKQLMSELSRELLTYVPDSNDIGMVNRLIAALTPMNKKTAILFFKHFLPWQMDDAGVSFTGKDKSEKRYNKKINLISEFLSVQGNDIWTWAEENIEVEKKAYDLRDNLIRSVKLALEGKEEGKRTLAADPLPVRDILEAVMTAGVKFDDILSVMTEKLDTIEERNAA